MKKVIIIDCFILTLFTAIVYNYCFNIPQKLGLGLTPSIFICLFVGGMFYGIIGKIVFSKYIQEKNIRKLCLAIFGVILFVFFRVLSKKIFDADLSNDYGLGIIFELGIPIVFSIITFFATLFAKISIINKYKGKGYQYILKDGNVYFEGEGYGENKEIIDKYDDNLAIKIRQGVYVGREEGNIRYYLGIPYAKPPIGDLRWKEPKSLLDSNKIYEAYNFASSSMQYGTIGNFVSYHKQSEDCLYINIAFNKISKMQNKPVIVVFHGGNFANDGSVNPLYDCKKFLKDNNDYVFVSFNYRLGFFGNIDLSLFEDGDEYKNSCNLNLLDQIAALQWVKENISSFGGDPNNVTVFGNGAGAVCISALAVCEKAKGLFNKAIIIAGNPSCISFSYIDSDKVTNIIKEKLNVKTVKELVNISTEKLQQFVKENSWVIDGPICDGKLVPKNIYDAYKKGKANDIEFILGIPNDEGKVVRSLMGEKYIDNLLEISNRYINREVNEEQKEIFDKIIGDKTSQDDLLNSICILFSVVGMIYLADCIAETNNKIYCFFWHCDTIVKNLGAGSLSCIATIFGNKDIAAQYGIIINDDTKKIMQLFINRFIQGNDLQIVNNEIKGVNAINWEEYKLSNKNYMYIKNNKMELLNKFYIDNFDIYEKLIKGVYEKNMEGEI